MACLPGRWQKCGNKYERIPEREEYSDFTSAVMRRCELLWINRDLVAQQWGKLVRGIVVRERPGDEKSEINLECFGAPYRGFYTLFDAGLYNTVRRDESCTSRTVQATKQKNIFNLFSYKI